MLTKDEILKADDLKTEVVEVPEWGGQVTIREMTGTIRDDFENSIYKKNGKKYEANLKNMRAKLCVACIIGEDNNPMFTWDSMSELRALSNKSSKALDRIFDACQKINGMSDKDVDDLAKNSEKTQTEDSTSL